MSYNILIVDDSEIVRAVIAKTLDIGGVPVGELYQAGNGKEALELLHEKWIDLVFTDINMPVMNGLEMLDAMLGDESLKHTPVVVISTEGSKTRIEDLIERGVRAYIRKPFTPEMLKEIVDKELGGQND